MLDLSFWMEAGGAEVWAGLLQQDEGEAYRTEHRKATNGGGESLGAS